MRADGCTFAVRNTRKSAVSGAVNERVRGGVVTRHGSKHRPRDFLSLGLSQRFSKPLKILVGRQDSNLEPRDYESFNGGHGR